MTLDAKDTKMKACIIRIAKDILEELGGSFVVSKAITWSNEAVKTIIKENKKNVILH